MKKAPQRTWGGRFPSRPPKKSQTFTESISFDWMLSRHDIAGSIAHAKGLAKVGVLTKSEAAKIERGLRAIEREMALGKFKWDPACEDVHMNIEAVLVRKIGAVGKKLHTARSRNDQVATDMRLWLRDAVRQTQLSIGELQRALVSLAERNADVVVPGYTHLQRAQPVLFAHHLLAYVEMLDRDHASLRRLRPARQPLPARLGRNRGQHDQARPRLRRQTARVRRRDAELDGRRQRPRFRGGISGGGGDLRDASVASCGRFDPVVERRVRLHHDCRCLHHRLVVDAAEEESRRRGTRARQDRADFTAT